MHSGACKARSAVSTGCENIPENNEKNEKNEKMNELNTLEDSQETLAKNIQWEEEWIRLSIVEKTALMTAHKNSYQGAKGDLGDARELFMDIKKDIEWSHRNLKNNHFPYKVELAKRIRALKLELRTPEEVAADEEAPRCDCDVCNHFA